MVHSWNRIDSDLIPSNIKSWVSIFWVVGDLEDIIGWWNWFTSSDANDFVNWDDFMITNNQNDNWFTQATIQDSNAIYFCWVVHYTNSSASSAIATITKFDKTTQTITRNSLLYHTNWWGTAIGEPRLIGSDWTNIYFYRNDLSTKGRVIYLTASNTRSNSTASSSSLQTSRFFNSTASTDSWFLSETNDNNSNNRTNFSWASLPAGLVSSTNSISYDWITYRTKITYSKDDNSNSTYFRFIWQKLA